MTQPAAGEWGRGPVWASLGMQEAWQHRLQLAADLWFELELRSVGRLRPSALQIVSVGAVPGLAQAAARLGLQVTPLEVSGSTMRVAVHEMGLAGPWLTAWNARMDSAIGQLLGFPHCCVEQFCKLWQEGVRDFTPMQARDGSMDGGWGANVLLRLLGLRLVPHLPCSFGCAESEQLAGKMLELVQEHELEAAKDLVALLSLPVEYSTLHGLAVLETPIFKLEQESLPARPERLRLSRRAVLEGPKLPEAPPAPVVPPDSWADNGFSSLQTMQQMHFPVMQAVPLKARSVLDLGCGDGALLEQLRQRMLHAFSAKLGVGEPPRVVGLEKELARVERGQKRHPEVELHHGWIEEAAEAGPLDPSEFDVTLFMPGRLLGLEEARAERVRQWLLRAKRLVLYCYEGELERLCQTVRLPVPPHIMRAFKCSAMAGSVLPTKEV